MSELRSGYHARENTLGSQIRLLYLSMNIIVYASVILRHAKQKISHNFRVNSTYKKYVCKLSDEKNSAKKFDLLSIRAKPE